MTDLKTYYGAVLVEKINCVTCCKKQAIKIA